MTTLGSTCRPSQRRDRAVADAPPVPIETSCLQGRAADAKADAARRIELLHKRLRSSLSDDERAELAALQEAEGTRLDAELTRLVCDAEQFEAQLRAYAEKRGIDFDELLARAARHFRGPLPTTYRPLTEAELEALVEDDMRHVQQCRACGGEGEHYGAYRTITHRCHQCQGMGVVGWEQNPAAAASPETKGGR